MAPREYWEASIHQQAFGPIISPLPRSNMLEFLKPEEYKPLVPRMLLQPLTSGRLTTFNLANFARP
jgi:hypothetical protein